MKLENKRLPVIVIDHKKIETLKLGENKLAGLATHLQGSRQFEIWATHHAPNSCTNFHRHDSEEVLIFFKGKGVIRTHEAEYPFEAPCSVILPAGTLHQVCNIQDELTDAIGIIACGSRIFEEDGSPSQWREDYLQSS